MYRLVAMDMDGTLVLNDGSIPEETMSALRRLSDNGVHLVLATGRMPKTCEIYAELLGGASIASFNAAVIKMTDGTEIKHELPSGTLKNVASFCHERGVYLQVYDGNRICVKETCPEFEGDLDSRINEHLELGELSEAVLNPSPKIVIVDFDADLIKKIRKELELLLPDLTVTQSSACVIEIMPKGIDKGYGIRQICDKMGIDLKDAVAIGDGQNDLAMFNAVGMGVAVANADPLLKEAADMVTEKESSYGVNEAIRTLFRDLF